jgi:glycosyltransferase involved in cell wall biosynthesis
MSPSATTVVVPVWGAYVAERLPEALKSVERQDRSATMVVVDNASSVAIPALPGVSVIRAPSRLTLGAARNLGLEQVKTPYVIFWDADDVMLPGTLAHLEQAIASDSRLGAYGAAIVEEPGGVRHRWPRRWVTTLIRAPRVFALLHSIWALYPTTGSTIIDAALARDVGGFSDTDSGDDWCLGVSLAFRGRIGWSERPGRLYSQHPGSIWARHSGARFLVMHSRVVRDRIRTDPGIPIWAKRLLPVIALAQWSAIAVHVTLEAARRLRS